MWSIEWFTVSPVSGTRSQQWCSGDLAETIRAGNLSVSLMLSWYLELGLTKLHLTTPGPGAATGKCESYIAPQQAGAQ